MADHHFLLQKIGVYFLLRLSFVFLAGITIVKHSSGCDFFSSYFSQFFPSSRSTGFLHSI